MCTISPGVIISIICVYKVIHIFIVLTCSKWSHVYPSGLSNSRIYFEKFLINLSYPWIIVRIICFTYILLYLTVFNVDSSYASSSAYASFVLLCVLIVTQRRLCPCGHFFMIYPLIISSPVTAHISPYGMRHLL